MGIPRLRAYAGPPLLSYGFRPFFLFGALYAALAILVWLPAFEGEITLDTAFTPRDWHIHEMMFGYVPAVIAGFLLTAIPNWTGRLPLQGNPLLVLVLTWIAGRIAVTFSATIGWLPAAVIDAAFLALLAAAAAREIIAGRNWRNLKVLMPVTLLLVANVAFHVEAAAYGQADVSPRLGLGAILLLIMVIGGRIIPSFTRNWLVRENPGRLPVPFGRLDAIAIGLSAAALLAWIIMPQGAVTAAALFAGGALQAMRLARWAGDRTARDRLVLVLHFAYAFVPVGFVLAGLAALGLVPESAGVHAWTVGAIGTMTLAVMTRASLGHTGGALAASPATQLIYGMVILAAGFRVAAALLPQYAMPLLHLASFGWIIAFGAFAVTYGPRLFGPRTAE